MIARRWALLLAIAGMSAAELNVGCGGAASAARAASKGAGGCSKAAKVGSAGAAANAERAAGASAAEAAAASHADDAIPKRGLGQPKDDVLPPTTTSPAHAAPEEPGPLREATETAVDVGSNAVDAPSDAEEE
ncbi:MAG TPA: hypothetical protein VI197_27210 [Polyangiaceae bacterium]